MNVLDNDGDVDGGALTVELLATPPEVTAVVLPDGRVRVSPDERSFGTYELRYRVRDSAGATSVDAPLTLTIEPEVRALIRLADGGMHPRLVVAGTDLDHPIRVSVPGNCAGASGIATSADGRVLVSTQCSADQTRLDIIAARPRDAIVAPSATLLTDAWLANGLALDAEGSRLFVVQRFPEGDDPFGLARFELVVIDVAARAVARRIPIPGYDNIYEIHPAVVGDSVLIQAHDPGAASGFDIVTLQIDAVSGTIAAINEPGSYAVFFGTSPRSADGRHFGNDWGPDGDLRGYDLAQLGALQTFWSASSGDFAYGEVPAFIPGTSTLAIRTYPGDRGEGSVWTVPLDGRHAPRRLTTFATTYSSSLPLSIGPNRLVYAGDAAIYGNSHVFNVDLASGSLTTITPPQGLFLEYFGTLGADAVWFAYFDDQQKRRLSLGRVSQPGVVEPVAPAIDAYYYTSIAADPFGTALAFSTDVTDMSGVYVVDVNLPSRQKRMNVGEGDMEYPYVLGVWSAP